MADKKIRTVVDDVLDGVRRMLEELDRLMNPQKRVKQPVPIPVPVRQPTPRRQQSDPYHR
jgi:hypothetical protein